MDTQRRSIDAATLAGWCTLVEASPLAMAVTIGAGHQLLCLSPALAHLLEAAPVDLLQHSLVDMVPSSTAGVVAGLLDRVFSDGVAEVMPDVEYAHPQHGPVFWSYTVWSLPLSDRPHAGLAIEVRETTADVLARQGDDRFRLELREVNEHLLIAALREQEAHAAAEAALQVRDQFLSIASHELRTPITSLLGYTQMLQQEPWGAAADAQARRMLAAIERQATRLNTLIGQMLDLARIEQGQFSLEQQPIELVAFVTRIVDDIRLAHREHTIALAHEVEQVMVLGDAVRLEQVVQNLLGNALKYSPGGSTVRVRVVERAGEAVLEIADQGIGIPAEAQAHLFEPFFRATNSGSRTSGFGIGLYIVKQIVAGHGGQIAVRSVEGQGSIFRVSVPVHTPAA